MKPGTVSHICHLSYLGGRDGKAWFETSSGKNPYLNKPVECGGNACGTSQTQKGELLQAKNLRHYLKHKAKKTGSGVLVVEHKPAWQAQGPKFTT
jgi:hypothetical protein